MGEHFALIDRLSDTGYSASVITTYNAYLPFYEQVVLRRLRAAGCALNIVMMDAGQLATCLGSDALRPRLAGLDYALVPVSVGGVFHPKVFLRLGKRKGQLFVGSHNLTLAGLGHNDEITTSITFDGQAGRGSVGHFWLVRDELRRYLKDALPGARDAFEAVLATAPWLAGVAPVEADVHVLASHADDLNLWERVRALVRGRVLRVLIVGPFFDDELSLVERVRTALTPEHGIWVALDPATAMVPAAKAAASAVRFVNINGLTPRERRRENVASYLHAKVIWIETDVGELLVAGSANPTPAAYLKPLKDRNAEVVVARWSNGTKDVLLREARLDTFLVAPRVSDAAWAEVAARKADKEGGDTTSGSPGALVAETTEEGFIANGPITCDCTVIDTADHTIGIARVVAPDGSCTRLACSNEIRDAAAFLVTTVGRRLHVHQTLRIGELFTSTRARAFRSALGRLDEDPQQLEALLHLTEKVIFDTPEITTSTRRGGAGANSDQDEPTTAISPDSLALDAEGRPTAQQRQRRSIASGDLAVLLDTLIRRLGQGLAVTESATTAPPPERTAEELAELGEDEAAEERVPEVDLLALAKLCQHKVKTLVNRMLAQFESAADAADSGEPARRSVVQLAAVLSVLRALRVYERRPEWRRLGVRLLDEKALTKLFDTSNALLVVHGSGMLDRAIVGNGGELFDELLVAVGLLVWLAWENGLDVERARGRGGQAGVTDELWEPLQRLLFLAPWCDERALAISADAVRASPRRGVDGDAWLQVQQAWLQDALEAASVSTPAPPHTKPTPGAFVLLSARFAQRLRLALEVDQGTDGDRVLVLQPDGARRRFAADRVEVITFRSTIHSNQAG